MAKGVDGSASGGGRVLVVVVVLVGDAVGGGGASPMTSSRSVSTMVDSPLDPGAGPAAAMAWRGRDYDGTPRNSRPS